MALQSTQDKKLVMVSIDQNPIVLDLVQNNNNASLYPKLFIGQEQLVFTSVNPSSFLRVTNPFFPTNSLLLC